MCVFCEEIMMFDKRTLSKALPQESGEIFALYQSVLGTEFCVWNEYYPGMLEIDADIAADQLYVLRADNGKIIAALSVVPKNELDECTCWKMNENTKELARVVVEIDHRGKGLAGEMVRQIERILQKQNCLAIHLSVAKGNLPAYRTYLECGFAVVGEAKMYGNDYYLMEKIL